MNFADVKAMRIPVNGTPRDVKRIAIGGATVWEKPSLPYDAVVGWLQASGGPYIVTGLSTPDIRRVAIKMEIVTRPPTGTDLIFGQYGHYGSNTEQGRLLMAALEGTGVHTIYDRPNSSRIRFSGSLPYIVENDTSFAAPQTITNSQRILVFRAAQDNAAGDPAPANGGVYRLYYLKMWGPDGLLRDFIPVRVGSGNDAVGYLYDSVTRTLFGNAGGGAFIVGPDATS